MLLNMLLSCQSFYLRCLWCQQLPSSWVVSATYFWLRRRKTGCPFYLSCSEVSAGPLPRGGVSRREVPVEKKKILQLPLHIVRPWKTTKLKSRLTWKVNLHNQMTSGQTLHWQTVKSQARWVTRIHLCPNIQVTRTATSGLTLQGSPQTFNP